jgi:eukaryotic-like serine/threonine-protein kinase
MDPERWRQIEELYQSAVDSDVAERANLLANAEPALRREVESLLAQPTAGTPLDRSAFSAVDRLQVETGVLIGPYRIEGLLGEGGMGVVYRAFDPKLRRQVAIKLLPDLADAAARHRFQREARTVTALNHPHILTVYDVGEHDGRQYLVTELVDGGTLRSWAAAEKRSPRQIVDVLVGVVDGLATAHGAGIIHRDIKPENILIAKNGYATLADFGLAKLFQPDTEHTSTRRETIAPTRPGMIAGTIGYMSPEQASGNPVDARSDIFSFGAVLYELFAGQRPFSSKSDLEELQRIIHGTPEPLGGEVPVRLRMVVEKALEKDPAERYQTAREMVIDLRRVSRQTGSGDAAEARSPDKTGNGSRALEITSDPDARPSRQSRLSRRAAAVWFIGSVCAASALALALVHSRQTAPMFGPIRVQIDTGIRLSEISAFSISPDGRHLVFAGAGEDGIGRLWIRSMDALAPQPLSGTEVALGGLTPPMFWSPDSRFIAFDAGGRLKKIDVRGAAPQTVCELPTLAVGGSWNRDDVIIVGNPMGGLIRCPASGGSASVVTRPVSSRGESAHLLPSFLPDGRHFLYLSVSRSAPETTGIYVRALDTTPEDQTATRILATGFGAAYVPDVTSGIGRLLFVRDATLFAQPFDAGRLRLSGDPVRIAEPIGSFLDGAFFSASTNGVLVFRGPDEDGQLTWFDRRGNIRTRASEPGRYSGLTLAPSESRAVLVKQTAQATADQDLWLLELSQSRLSRLTFDSRLEDSPVWSHDGSRVFFTATGTVGSLFEQSLSGTDPAQLLLQTDEHKIPTSASSDGQFLLYTAMSQRATRLDLWVLPLKGDRKPFPFVRREFDQLQGQFSPDGRWVAYVSNESGRHEVLVRPFTPAGATDAVESSVVSKGGGASPRWGAHGKELYYLSPNGTVTSVAFDTDRGLPTGPHSVLFQVPGAAADWAVTRDGERFLLAAPAGHSTQSPFTVVFNWEVAVKQ